MLIPICEKSGITMPELDPILIWWSFLTQYDYSYKKLIVDTKVAGNRHNYIYSVNCVCISCSSDNITVLGYPQLIDKRILLRDFFHVAFHFGVRKRIQNLVLH